MHGLRIVFGISLLIIVFCEVLHAQQQTPQNPTAPEDTTAADLARATKIFDSIDPKALHESTRAKEKIPKSNRDFIDTVPKFRRATEELRESVESEDKLKRAAQSLSKLIPSFADYFKALKLKGKPVDSEEFKSYTQKELNWEVLTTAERVDNDLQRARIYLRREDRSGATSIQTMEFFMGIQTDLARLKWLSSRVGPSRNVAARVGRGRGFGMIEEIRRIHPELQRFTFTDVKTLHQVRIDTPLSRPFHDCLAEGTAGSRLGMLEQYLTRLRICDRVDGALSHQAGRDLGSTAG